MSILTQLYQELKASNPKTTGGWIMNNATTGALAHLSPPPPLAPFLLRDSSLPARQFAAGGILHLHSDVTGRNGNVALSSV